MRQTQESDSATHEAAKKVDDKWMGEAGPHQNNLGLHRHADGRLHMLLTQQHRHLHSSTCMCDRPTSLTCMRALHSQPVMVAIGRVTVCRCRH